MRPMKMDALRKKHPKLDLPNCSCGDGWFDILDNLCARLDSLELPTTFLVLEIKEKFGELRFYTAGVPDEMRYQIVERFVSYATGESIHVCETCGRPGRWRKLHWVQTLCWWHYVLAWLRQ
jgi:hypothetical protein